jgi:hypothetical protein
LLRTSNGETATFTPQDLGTVTMLMALRHWLEPAAAMDVAKLAGKFVIWAVLNEYDDSWCVGNQHPEPDSALAYKEGLKARFGNRLAAHLAGVSDRKLVQFLIAPEKGTPILSASVDDVLIGEFRHALVVNLFAEADSIHERITRPLKFVPLPGARPC